MFLKIRPFLFALVYLLSLEMIIFRPVWVFYITFFILVVSLFEGKNLGKKWRFSILPFFFSLSSIALLYLITLDYEQHIFIILSTAIYYLTLLGSFRLGEYAKDQTAKGMVMAATSATIFFAYSSAYGLYLNFLVPLYFLMIAYLLITLLISYQYFTIIKNERKKIWIYSFLLALIMSEIIWTMNFWPFGYLTTGVIALILYYVLWDMIQSYFLEILSKKRIVINMVFFSAMIVMVLITSKWIPII